MPRGDRPDEGGVPPRAARVHHLPHGAPAAQGVPEGDQADQAADPRVLREMPRQGREGQVGEERAEDRHGRARREVRLLAMPLSPFAGGGTVNGRRTFLRGFLSVLLSGGAIGGVLKILPSKADAKEV